MDKKYFKPKSLTWWSGFVPLTAGLIVASEPLHQMHGLADTIRNATDFTPSEMVATGLGVIGLRGAV